MTQTFVVTVKVTADPATFRDGEDPATLEAAVRQEIVSNLESCGAHAQIVTLTPETAPLSGKG